MPTCLLPGFRWNFPASERPPCDAPEFPVPPVDSSGESLDSREWTGWAHTQRSVFQTGGARANTPCGEADGSSSTFHPDLNPTGNICNRNYRSTSQNCWGVCIAEDVLDGDEMRDWMLDEVRLSVSEVSDYFRIRPRTSLLRLSESSGSYLGLYIRHSMSTDPECGKDAKRIYRLPITQEMCTVGVDADAILFISMPQYVPGTAGYGAAASKDQYGRPIVLSVSWSVPSAGGLPHRTAETEESRARLHSRGVLVHELIHALGFGILSFTSASNYGSARVPVVQQLAMTDLDGRTDLIWHAVGPRTVQAAARYFNCSSLTSVPLMGENQLGDRSRGSHWETRILNDEVMSYGESKMVSELTLAMMEDLGLYLGNYSRSQCMFWGRSQGCDFVSSRCGMRRDDLSISAVTADNVAIACNRAYPKTFGAGGPHTGNAILVDKCARLDCSSTMPVDGKCNAECILPSSDEEKAEIAERFMCGTVPDGDVVVAASHSIYVRSLYSSYSRTFMIIVGILLVVILLAYQCFAHAVHYPKLRAIFLLLNVILFMSGVAIVSLGTYIYMFKDFYVNFYGVTTLKVGFCTCCVVTAWGVCGFIALYAIRRGWYTPLVLYLIILMSIMLIQSIGSVILMVWVVDSYDAENGMYESVGLYGGPAVTGAEWADKHIGRSLVEIESMACNTYQYCCWFTQTDSTENSCYEQHGGLGASQAASLKDPGRNDFCEAVTGIHSSLGAAETPGSCTAFEDAGVINMTACAADYCTSGVAGFQSFVSHTFEFIRGQIVWFALALGIFFFFESVLFSISVAILCLHHKDKVHTEHLPTSVVEYGAYVDGKHLEVDPRYLFVKALRKSDPGVCKGGSVPESRVVVRKWCTRVLKADFPHLRVRNFSGSWTDGQLLCALIYVFRPAILDWSKVRTGPGVLSPEDMQNNVDLARKTAIKHLGLSLWPAVDFEGLPSSGNQILEYVCALKRVLTSTACANARALEDRDAAREQRKREHKRRWRKAHTIVKFTSIDSADGARDPRRHFTDALRVLDPYLFDRKQNLAMTTQELLKWAKSSTESYEQVSKCAWRRQLGLAWADGVGFCALLHAHRPHVISWKAIVVPDDGMRLSQADASHNLRLAASTAARYLDVPPDKNVDLEKLQPDSSHGGMSREERSECRKHIANYMVRLHNLLTSNASVRASSLESLHEGAEPPPAFVKTDSKNDLELGEGDDVDKKTASDLDGRHVASEIKDTTSDSDQDCDDPPPMPAESRTQLLSPQVEIDSASDSDDELESMPIMPAKSTDFEFPKSSPVRP